MSQIHDPLQRRSIEHREWTPPLGGLPLSQFDEAADQTKSVTIFVVDPNTASRNAVCGMLADSGHQLVEHHDADQAFQELQGLSSSRAACLLVDVLLPSVSGFDLNLRLNECGIYLPVVYMGADASVSQAVQAMQKGAVAFLEKPFSEQALDQALDKAQQLAMHFASVRQWRERLARLTARERQVLALVLKEKLNKQIADELKISKKTVEVHRANMMQALAARSALHLVTMAFLGRVV